MSNDWLTGSKTKRSRMLDAVQKDRRLAIQIQDDLDNNQVERVLSKVDSNGNLKTIRLDGGGTRLENGHKEDRGRNQ